jgi:pimeloyl-ACP methyl ester carboxylesterase
MERRRFCKSIAAGAAGLAAVGTATADDSKDVAGYVSTRGHFDIAWGNEYLVDGYDATDYDVTGDVPGYEGDPPEELVVMIHGFSQTPKEAREDIIGPASGGFRAAGYDGPVVGYTWDSDFDTLEWWDTVDIATRNGLKLGQFLADHHDRSPDTTVRVVGHSLGAEIVLNAIEELDRAKIRDAVDSVTMLGAAVDDEAPSTWAGPLEDEYGHEIERAVGSFDNFYKTDDETLTGQYEFAEWDSALGASGIEGHAPGNYSDHEVDYVGGHEQYFLEDTGCAGAVVDSW